jgi:hypothetical protein
MLAKPDKSKSFKLWHRDNIFSRPDRVNCVQYDKSNVTKVAANANLDEEHKSSSAKYCKVLSVSLLQLFNAKRCNFRHRSASPSIPL